MKLLITGGVVIQNFKILKLKAQARKHISSRSWRIGNVGIWKSEPNFNKISSADSKIRKDEGLKVISLIRKFQASAMFTKWVNFLWMMKAQTQQALQQGSSPFILKFVQLGFILRFSVCFFCLIFYSLRCIYRSAVYASQEESAQLDAQVMQNCRQCQSEKQTFNSFLWRNFLLLCCVVFVLSV